MIRGRKSAYPDTVTPRYSKELLVDFNKLRDPQKMKEVYMAIQKIINKGGEGDG